MKTLHKRDRSDLNKSGRSGQLGSNVSGRRSQTLEVGIQRVDGPAAADIKMRSFIYLQAAAKLADAADVQTRSNRLMGLSKTRLTTSILLPPIIRASTISGKEEHTAALLAPRKESAKPRGNSAHLQTGNIKTENVFHVLVTQCGKVNQELNKYNQISVAGNKAAADRGRHIKWTFCGRPAATLTPAPVEPPAQQRKNDTRDRGVSDSSTMMPVKVKHDATVCKETKQRGFHSSDSAIETESGDSEDKGHLERLNEDSDDEYYTDQRITEWVLKVNSSLFTTGDEELKGCKRVEEQDVATIKIIYTGD